MAVRGDGGRIVFYLTNTHGADANPPIIFSDFHDDSHFSFSIWVKVLDKTVGDVLFVLEGPQGSKLLIGHDGAAGNGQWYYHLRKEEVAIYAAALLTPVVEGIYTVFCISKIGPVLSIVVGNEPFPGATETHVNLVETVNVTPGFEFDFDHLAFVARDQWAICNFKYWNYSMNWTEFKEQVHYFDWEPRQVGIPGGDKYPIWSSPLRVPGDLSNTAHPGTSPTWSHAHAYFIITPTHVPMKFEEDPAFMAKYSFCETWLYELSIKGTIQQEREGSIQNYVKIQANPGTTPTIQTDVIGDKYYEFQDRGSVPLVPVEFTGLTFYGYPSNDGTGPGQASTWGAYKDENGVDILDTSNTVFQFEPDTGVNIPAPGASPAMLYLWKYGAMFRWAPHTPQVPAGTGTLQYLFLYVRYRGYPSALPTLPVEDLAGLFAVNKGGKSVDRYNRGVELKIPDPTIRTAYIGE